MEIDHAPGHRTVRIRPTRVRSCWPLECGRRCEQRSMQRGLEENIPVERFIIHSVPFD